MARRKAAAPATLETPPAPVDPVATDAAETTVRRRRRRRTTAPDYATETKMLVDAVLRSRGPKGATQDALQSVVNWARTVRAEGEALRELSGRPRRQKAQAPAERMTRFEMNRALLEGVLAGAISIDVQDDGTLVFLDNGTGSLVEEEGA